MHCSTCGETSPILPLFPDHPALRRSCLTPERMLRKTFLCTNLTWLPPDRQKPPGCPPGPSQGCWGMQVMGCRIPGEEGWTGSSLSAFPVPVPSPLPPYSPALSPAILMTGPFIMCRDDCPTSVHPELSCIPNPCCILHLLLPLLLIMKFSKTQLRGPLPPTPRGYLLHFPNYLSLRPPFFVHTPCDHTLVLMRYPLFSPLDVKSLRIDTAWL